MKFLKLLTETPGVPGREERIRAVIEQEIKGVFDEQRVDALGNLICIRRADKVAKGAKGAKPRRIMIAAHMDQIGFYVKHVDDKGFIRIHNAGGFDTRNLPAHRVLVQGKKELIGVLNPAGKPIHIASDEERKKQYVISDFAVDVGLPGKTVKDLVRVGDPVTLVQDFAEIGDLVTGQAMDNRVACWTAVRALQKIKKSQYEIAVVFTVQEEVGLRGAGPATFGLEPDIAVALDTTLACDTPGISDDQAVTKCGGGVGIKIMDGASISDRGLVDELAAVAQKHKIAFQYELLPLGGTDAGAMQRSRGGYKTITLSIPTRYIHTVTECVHKDDLHAARDLLAAWLGG
jgi:tetrahedral aminopeptidase